MKAAREFKFGGRTIEAGADVRQILGDACPKDEITLERWKLAGLVEGGEEPLTTRDIPPQADAVSVPTAEPEPELLPEAEPEPERPKTRRGRKGKTTDAAE